MKLPTLSSPLKLFAPAPAGPAFGMAGASGGHMMFASSGNGGRGGYDEDDLGFDDEFIDEPPMDEPEPEEPRRRPRSTRTVRASAAGGGGETGGQPRVAQHQPEERYWTDYLRIALPVIGLLLMIGLLWYWATQLIGDTPDPTEPEDEQIGLVNQSTPAPTQQPAEVEDGQNTGTQGNTIGIGDTETTPEAPAEVTTEPAEDPATDDNQTDTEAPADDAAEEPAEEETGALFESTDSVVVTEDGLNVRPDASTAGDPIGTLNAGEVVTIISGPVEAEGYTWWEVTTEDGLTTGFVVQEFLEPAE